MTLHNDLTTGNVRSHILRFAFPLIVSNLFQAMYNAVDMFFVGHYTNTEGLSAVSVSGPIMNTMVMTISGLSVGVSVVIGLKKGQGNPQEIKKSANTAIALYLLLALVVTILGVLFTPFLLKLVNTPDGAFDNAVSYLRTIFAGIVFMFGYHLICAFQRGFGDSKSSMLFVIVAALTNIVLDFIFIRYCGMGVFGAAIATVISQAVSFIMGVVYFKVNKHLISFKLREIRMDKEHLLQLLQLGLPASLQQLLLNISLMTLSGLANSFGLAASVAYGIGIKVDSFALLPSDAINASMSSFCSQNLGAGKPERTLQGLKQALKLSLLMSSFVAVLVACFAPQIAAVFNAEAKVLSFASQYLRISCISYLAYGIVYPFVGFLRGTGNAMVTLYNVVLAQYVVRIPIAFLFTGLFGFPGIAVAVISSPVFSDILYGVFVLTGRWKRSREVQFAIAVSKKNDLTCSGE